MYRSSKVDLLEDAELNVFALGSDGKTDPFQIKYRMHHSSKVDLLEDAELNVFAFGSDGKTDPSYKGQRYCCGAYDTLSEIDR